MGRLNKILYIFCFLLCTFILLGIMALFFFVETDEGRVVCKTIEVLSGEYFFCSFNFYVLAIYYIIAAPVLCTYTILRDKILGHKPSTRILCGEISIWGLLFIVPALVIAYLSEQGFSYYFSMLINVLWMEFPLVVIMLICHFLPPKVMKWLLITMGVVYIPLFLFIASALLWNVNHNKIFICLRKSTNGVDCLCFFILNNRGEVRCYL